MSRQAVIFDLDGTLVDTLQDLADAANQALQEQGLAPLPVQQYKTLVGAGAGNLILRCLAAAGVNGTPDPAQVAGLIEAFKAAYAQNWHVCTRPYPGISQMLLRLRRADLRLAVLSNKPDSFTQQVVACYFPDRLFDAVLGQTDTVPLKPDPAGALLLCRRLDCEPENTVLVGDTGTDMETAVRAGLQPVGVLWGFRSAKELLAGGARQVFATPADLVTWLLDFAAVDS